MLKTSFQKLLLATPVRPNIVAVFAVILGALGIFLPPVYLYINIQDSLGTTTSLVISRSEIFSVVDMWNCSASLKHVELPPIWISEGYWNAMFRVIPLLVGMQYFSSHGSKKTKNVVFALVMLYLVLYIGFSSLFAPETITCSSDWQLTIYDYSISWFSISVPVISLLLGTYAIQKRKMITKIKTQ